MLIPIKEVARRLGVSRATAERLRRNPDVHFPKAISIGPNSIRFDEIELEQWLNVRRKEGAV